MKIKERPRLELLYRQDNLIIPLEKGQIRAVHEFLDTVGQIDPTKNYTVKISLQSAKEALTQMHIFGSYAKSCPISCTFRTWKFTGIMCEITELLTSYRLPKKRLTDGWKTGAKTEADGYAKVLESQRLRAMRTSSAITALRYTTPKKCQD